MKTKKIASVMLIASLMTASSISMVSAGMWDNKEKMNFGHKIEDSSKK
jgi:hypothetical protein